MDQTTRLEAPAGVDAALVAGWVSVLQSDLSELDDAARVDLIRTLEVLKCAAEGAQAALTADLDTSQRDQAMARGVSADRVGQGVAHQVAFARRESPHRGQRHLGLAKVLVAELPHTFSALRAGRITEWRATLLARETACLSLADRQAIDVELAGDPEALEAMGDGELVAAARRRAYAVDGASFVARRARAEAERTVTVRPAPETMTWLTSSLPVQQGIAVYAELRAEADRRVAAGDGRTRGQIMADTLVARILHATTNATQEPPVVPVSVNVVVPVETLLGADDEPAEVPGYGPIPADLLRQWIHQGLAAGVQVQLRRLFAQPATGQLVAMESTSRAFPKRLGEFLEFRDQRCRHPWCDAPIRHRDHVVSRAQGGETSAENGQGLCEACNYAKEAIGWRAQPRPGPVHTVATTTPTGHTYQSTAPPAIRPRLGPLPAIRLDLDWTELTYAA
jgi:hypothetical protein